MSEWTREHDQLIAEVAEGFRTEIRYPAGICIMIDIGDIGPPIVGRRIDNYSAGIVAVIRAADAWRNQGKARHFSFHSPNDVFRDWESNFYSGGRGFKGNALSPGEAIAWALWRACGGNETAPKTMEEPCTETQTENGIR